MKNHEERYPWYEKDRIYEKDRVQIQSTLLQRT